MNHDFLEMSGRFDGDAQVWAEYLFELAERYNALVVSLTEAQQPNVVEIFRKVFGYEWRIQLRGEHLVLTRFGAVRRLTTKGKRRAAARLLFVTRINGLASWRQFHGMVFNFWIDGRRVRLLPFHAPASVQKGSRWNLSSLYNRLQVAASKRGFRRLGESMDRFQKRNPHAIQIATGDSNYDTNMDVWNEWLEEHLGSSVWKVDTRGTHAGGRRIDTAHVRGDVDGFGGEVVPGQPPRGFDHCAIHYWVGW